MDAAFQSLGSVVAEIAGDEALGVLVSPHAVSAAKRLMGRLDAWFEGSQDDRAVALLRALRGRPGGRDTEVQLTAVVDVHAEVKGFRSELLTLVAEAIDAERGGSDIDIAVYLDSDDDNRIDRVMSRFDHLISQIGLQDPSDISVQRGSIFRRAIAQLKPSISSEEMNERLAKLEKAVQLRVVDKRQAEVNDQTAVAVSRVLAEIADIPNVCMRIGSFVIIKYEGPQGPVLLCRELNAREQLALGRFPEIQQTPERFIDSLATAVVTMDDPDSVRYLHEGSGPT